MDDSTDDSLTIGSELAGIARVVAGRYRIKGRLGRGASKEVYLAYDERLDRDVALAIVVAAGGDTGDAAAAAAARARVTREAQVTGRLGDHPNVITVYDHGEHDGVPFLVLRAMEGGSLAAAIKCRRPAIDDAIRRGCEVAAALAHAHAHGVVHRDVKPDNVWLGADGAAALGDFGVATRPGAERLTAEGVVVGTVRYLSPEQIRGDDPGPASDLYALGVTLYELVTGEVPFDGPDAERVLVQHLTVAPEPPSARVANVPPALERLILELLAKHPAQRPASAALVEHELARMAPRAGRDAGDGGQVLCPFKGLAPFDSADAPYFCGRDRLVAQLVARLVGAPLLGVLGPSGSGKSSVLRAGLLPALASGALPGSEHWVGAVIRPGRRPLAELERALQSAAGQPLVVAVDQFEETFIACPDEDERRAFIDALVAAPRAGEPRCTVVLALRADYYGRCAQYDELAGALATNHVLVGPLRGDELREAIEVPARRAGLRIDSELTEALLHDVEGEPGALPLLSTALLELWERRDGRRLTHAAYERAGGARGAVARLAEDAFARLGDEQQAIARGVLMRLVVEGADGRVELRRVARRELTTAGGADAAQVVELLTSSRLLTGDATTVELAHEALLHEWPRLRSWIDEDREGLRAQQSLRTAAGEWLRLGRDEGALYRGGRLDEARRWRDARRPALNDLEREFLAASDARRRRDHATLLRRRVLTAASVLAVLVAIAVVAASRRESQLQRDTGASRELAARSASLVGADPALGRRIALAAYERHPSDAAGRAVRQATHEDRGTAVLPVEAGIVWSVAASEDGSRVATAGEDGTVLVWDVRRRRVVRSIAAGGGSAQAMGFSRDGATVATADADGRVTVTDVEDGRSRKLSLQGRDPDAYAGANSIRFGDDDRALVVGGHDGTVRLVRIESGSSRTVMGIAEPHSAARRGAPAPAVRVIQGAELDPGAQRIVSVGSDGLARIHEIGGDLLHELGDGTPAINDAAFSPDGRRVATAGNDGRIRLWSTGSGRPAEPSIEVAADQLHAVRYSRDGRRIVVAGADGHVRVLDVEQGLVVDELKGHRGPVRAAAFVAGDTVASGGEDGDLRLWAASGTRVLAARATAMPSFAGDRAVLWAGPDGSLHRWDPLSGRDTVVRERDGCTGCVTRVSADGSTVASVSSDGSVRFFDGSRSWRLRTRTSRSAIALDESGRRVAIGGPRPAVMRSADGGGRVELSGQRGAIISVLAFAPAGGEVATGATDGTVRILDAGGRRAPRVLGGHAGAVTFIAYSSDGTRLVTAGVDTTIRISSVAGGPARVLHGHEGTVATAVFDRAGERIVSASRDGAVRVWDATAGQELVVLERYATATAASFSPVGERVLSAGHDAGADTAVLRVSPCDVCGSFASVLATARARADRKRSSAELAQIGVAP